MLKHVDWTIEISTNVLAIGRVEIFLGGGRDCTFFKSDETSTIEILNLFEGKVERGTVVARDQFDHHLIVHYLNLYIINIDLNIMDIYNLLIY